jgi:nucleotide-binding universal stress UspA family protein
MRIMATFDGSPFAEAILPLLERLAALPNAEFILFRAVDEGHGVRAGEMGRPQQAYGFSGQGTQPRTYEQAEPSLVANKEQATEARLGDVGDYLSELGRKLPKGAVFTVHPELDKDSAAAITRAAERLKPDVIVMATHGHSGIVHALVGSVTEKVIQSGVAPVLVVHPQEVKDSRKKR